MAFKDVLRARMAAYFLRREKEPARKKKGANFSTADSVAIIAVDTDEQAFKKLRKYVQHLRTEHQIKNVVVFSFINGNEKDVPVYHAHKLEYDYFTFDDLTWNLKPGQAIKNFILRDFDILIDATHSEYYPLRYVLINSVARMKVGRTGHAASKFLDLSLDVPTTSSFDEFMSQADHYLSKFSFK